MLTSARTRCAQTKSRRRFRPLLDLLEDRCLPAALPPAELVSWYRAEGNANDFLGANHGSLENGAAFAPGMVGQGFALDGVDDCVTIPDSPSLTPASISLEAWILPDTLGDRAIITKYDSGVQGVSWFLGTTSAGRLSLYVYENFSAGLFRGADTTNPVVTTGTWQHVAGSFDSATQEIKLYVNGVEVASTLAAGSTVVNSINDTDTPVRIGTYFGSGSVNGPVGFWDGAIDEVVIYRRALNSGEVQSLYSAGSEGKATLVVTTADDVANPDDTVMSLREALNASNASVGDRDVIGFGIPRPFTNGLVGWWRGEENANDSMQTNHGALMNGAAFAPGRFGHAFDFDGVDDTVVIPDSPSLRFGTGDFTVDAMINTTFLGGSALDFVVSKGIVGNGVGWLLAVDANGSGGVAGEAVFVAGNGSTSFAARSGINVADGNWHHLAGVRRGLNLEFYVDGVLAATVSTGSLIDFNNADNVHVSGRQSPGFDPFFNGRIDEVGIFNRALSGAEIQSIATGPRTISPTSALPTITDPVVIDGYTQPGASQNTLAVGNDAVLRIELDGSNAGPGDGLQIFAGGCVVRGLVINRFSGDGIDCRGGGCIFAGNFIGTDPTGTLDLGNSARGIYVYANGGNTVGGTSPADRNVISGNGGNGITISASSNNVVQGNYIGTNAAGTAFLRNDARGVLIDAHNGDVGDGPVDGNVIGGASPGAGNLISGNYYEGVAVFGWSALLARNNVIEGNLIGTNAAGAAALPNGPFGFSGIILSLAEGTNIGGTDPAARNIISGNGSAGIQIGNGEAQTTGNIVQGNYIGTDVTGSFAVANRQFGIELKSPGNTIGGAAPGAGNVISGNLNTGLCVLHGNRSVIQGNYIGTDATGLAAIPNSTVGSDGGVRLSDCLYVTLGGAAPEARNVISGNKGSGVTLAGIGLNRIEGNYIGVDATGAGSLGNGYGMYIASDGFAGDVITGNVVAHNSTFGIYVAAGSGRTIEANHIFANGWDGVQIYPDARQNRITGNSIHDNGLLGINLYSFFDPDSGVTLNDSSDADSDSNNLQNFPVITSAVSSGGATTITGTLSSQPATTYRLEFFASPAADPSSYGEGQTYLGYSTVVTDDSGNASFKAAIGESLPKGQAVVSATATDPSGNTSEFSQAVLGETRINADLSVSISGPKFADVGTNLIHTITVRNDGPYSANNVTLTDTLTPADAYRLVWTAASQGTFTWSQNTVTFSVGVLAAGASATATVELIPTWVAVEGLKSMAQVAASESDPDTSNNLKNRTTHILPAPQVLLPADVFDLHTTGIGTGLAAANAIAIQPDGKIVAAGSSGPYFALARYNPDGSLDTSFDFDGLVATDIYGGDAQINGIAVQPNGKIVAVGSVSSGNNTYLAVARYNRDGSLDNRFGSQGNGKFFELFPGTATSSGRSVALQPDGKIVVAGVADGLIALARYDRNGRPDLTFGPSQGKITVYHGTGGAYAVALLPDGRIVVAGGGTNGSITDFGLVRLKPDGRLDTSFGNAGRVATDFDGGLDFAYGMAIQPDGKIIVAGETFTAAGTQGALARYESDGSLDHSFSFDGKAVFGSNLALSDVVVQSNGRIVAAGSKDGRIAVARLSHDGSPDASFDSDGLVTTQILDNSQALAVALQTDGKIVVGGYAYSALSGAEYLVVARYRGDAPDILVTGADAGSEPRVHVFDAITRAPKFDFLAYDAKFVGGVRVASADVNGDLVPDIITAPGPGNEPRVKVFDGGTGALLKSFLPYPADYQGGIYVAAADLTGDRRADFVTGQGAGKPIITVFDGLTTQPLLSFRALPKGYSGGVSVAIGDVNGDGYPDIIAGSGPGALPLVTVFNGYDFQQFPGRLGRIGLGTAFQNGVQVSSADVDGDGLDDIIVGAAGGLPRVQVYSGKDRRLLTSFLAYDDFAGGVRGAAGDVNGDGKADIITGPGRGQGQLVKIFDVSKTEIDSFFADEFDLEGGAFVAASRARRR